ncbi:MAG: helix-turn-helix transcriptional regulator [Actinoplanes sp.]
MPETTRPRRKAPVDHDPVALKWARERAGWRQSDLARELGISRSVLSEAESGTRGLSPAVKNRLAAVLNCPVTVFERKAVAS